MPCTSHRIALAIFPVFHAFHTALLHDFVQASCLHQSMPMKTPGVSGGSRGVHPQTLSCLFDKLWLVVYLPLWKIWICQSGWWHSQSMESHKSHVPKHQSAIFGYNTQTMQLGSLIQRASTAKNDLPIVAPRPQRWPHFLSTFCAFHS